MEGVVVAILWLQNDALFGREGDDMTWPHALREIVHPLAKPQDGIGGGRLVVDNGARASFADVIFARRLSDGIRILTEHAIDIALIGVPLNFLNIRDVMPIIKGIAHQRPGDPATLHSDQVGAARWVDRMVVAVRKSCHVQFFTLGAPQRFGFEVGDFDVKAHDSPAIHAVFNNVIVERARDLLAKCDVATLQTLYKDLNDVNGDVERLADLLTKTNAGMGDDNKSPAPELLVELFPDLALRVFRGDVWRNVQLLWAQARTALGDACIPSRKALALSRLLNSRAFNWDGKLTFAMGTVSDLVPELMSSSCASMSPVEFCFHGPQGHLENLNSFSADQRQTTWIKIREAAAAYLDLFLAKDALDVATQKSLLLLRQALQNAQKPSDVRAADASVYDPGLRWDVDKLREAITNLKSTDGTAIPVVCQIGESDFVDQRLSFHAGAASDACRCLAEDLASNFCATRILVTSGGDWPREGWFAIWGDVIKGATDIEEVFRKNQKGKTGLLFLGHYFSCVRFCDVGSGLSPLPSDSVFLSKPSELEEQLRSLGATNHNRAGYVMILRDFPPKK
jgi:hypothetical protein